MARLTQSGAQGGYLVGQGEIAAAAAGLTKGDEIETLSGDLTLTACPTASS